MRKLSLCLGIFWALFLGRLTAQERFAAEPPAATITTTETHAQFVLAGQTVASYQFAGTVAQEKDAAKQKPLAKPFFFPLIAPNGVSVTRPWPIERGQPKETTDHYHQKSAWFCHGDVIPEGLELQTKSSDKHVQGVDFWSEFGGHGRIVAKATQFNPTTGLLVSELEWRTPDDLAIVNETRTIGFIPTKFGYLITLKTELAPTKFNLTFGDTKEGSLGIRIRDEFRATIANTGGMITSSDGTVIRPPVKDNLSIWGKVADWHDYSGTIDGKTAGIAILDHPKNPHRAAWHTRAYGLMAANPFARGASGFPGRKGEQDLVRLKVGESLTLHYALYVHDGGAESVADAYRFFAQ